MDKWIVPLRKLCSSREETQNFLFNHEKFFIMDNHRAAAWCWAQKLNFGRSYNLFHIDRHYDWGKVCDLTRLNIDLPSISIFDYLDLEFNQGDGQCPVFYWDNSMPVFNKLYPKVINEWFFATQEETQPMKLAFVSVKEDELLSKLENLDNGKNWIINIDIDYFFNRSGEQILDDSYIKGLCAILEKQMNRIQVVTIALSPECCGGTPNSLGWNNSIRVAEMISNCFGLGFKIDHSLVKKD